MIIIGRLHANEWFRVAEGMAGLLYKPQECSQQRHPSFERACVSESLGKHRFVQEKEEREREEGGAWAVVVICSPKERRRSA